MTRLNSGFVREIKTDNYLQRSAVSFKASGASVARLDKETYINLKTGEVGFYNHTAQNAGDNIRRVQKRCNEFKWLVRANAGEARLFVTLTYAENMTDQKRLYEDFRRFWQRLKRAFPEISGYLVAFEPQRRGAWHAHIILLSPECLYIPHEKMEKLWGFGFIKVEDCRNIDDLGDYLTAYLTKLDGKKGSRLSLYPPFFRFLRWSRGVKRPEITEEPDTIVEIMEAREIEEEWVKQNDFEWEVETQNGILYGRTVLYINKILHKKRLAEAEKKYIIGFETIAS